jgi:N-acetylmuramoyl-L-alanine amidase
MKYLKQFWPIYLAAAFIFVGISMLGSDAVTTIAEALPPDREVVFIIDAGHGGEDGGAVSCTGVKESIINLQIALRLDDLMHLLGRETKMIRTEDVSVHTSGATVAARKASDLRQRAKIVNETKNAILVSIHQNFFTQSQYCGAQMFYNSHDDAKQLAQQLQNSFVATLNPGSNRQIKAVDGIFLMEHIDRPGVLVECGFLSNPQEEARLRDDAYQKKIACVIASALVNLDYQTND